MTQNSILVYKNWTCSFSPITYSLKYSGLEILDNEADHHELVKSLLFFINKKQKSRCKFFRITDDELHNVLNNNFKSAFICTQEISAILEDGGSIVNIASVGGQIGGPNAPHYSASKGALITFTKSTARLLAGRKIRVNAVSPGFIETDMFSHILKKQGKSRKDIINTIPLNRIGRPSDVANAVGFLLGDKSSYITGQILNVNGGSLI